MMCFAQTFNDIQDLRLDDLAGLNRPLVTGEVSVLAAKRTSGMLIAISVVSACLAGIPTVLLDLVCITSAWLYSKVLKRVLIVGNLVVAVVSAATLLYTSGFRGLITTSAAIGFGVAACYLTGNELFKTAIDCESDRAGGVTTVANTFGLRPTTWLIAASWLALSAVAALGAAVASYVAPYVVVAVVVVMIPTLVGTVVALNIGDESNSASMFRGWQRWRLAWYPGFLLLVLLK